MRVSKDLKKIQSSKILSNVFIISGNSKSPGYYSYCSGLGPTTDYLDSVTADQYSMWLLCIIVLNNNSS